MAPLCTNAWPSSLLLIIASSSVLWNTSVNREKGAFCTAFLIPKPSAVSGRARAPEASGSHLPGQSSSFSHSNKRTSPSAQHMVAAPDIDSNDAFAVLGLDPYDENIDKKVIKKAFRKLAVKFHPDAVTSIESSEYEKKWASEQFAKISSAYEALLEQLRETGSVRPTYSHQSGPYRNMRRPSSKRRKSAYPDNFSAQYGPTSSFYSSVSTSQSGPQGFWVGAKDTFNNPKYHYNPNSPNFKNSPQKNPFGEYWKNNVKTNFGDGTNGDSHWYDSTEYNANEYGACGDAFGGHWVGAKRDLDPRYSYGHNQNPDSLDSNLNETVFTDFYSGEEAAKKYEYKPREYPKRSNSSPVETMFNDFTKQVDTEAYKHKRFYNSPFVGGVQGVVEGEETIFNDFYSGDPEAITATLENAAPNTTATTTGSKSSLEDFLTGAFNGDTDGSTNADKTSSTVSSADDVPNNEEVSAAVNGGIAGSYTGTGFSGGAVASHGSLHETAPINGETVNVGKAVVNDAAKKAAATTEPVSGGVIGGTAGSAPTHANPTVPGPIESDATTLSGVNSVAASEVAKPKSTPIGTFNGKPVNVYFGSGASDGETNGASSTRTGEGVTGTTVSTMYNTPRSPATNGVTSAATASANVGPSPRTVSGAPNEGDTTKRPPMSHVTATSGVSVGAGTGTSSVGPVINKQYDGPETVINDFGTPSFQNTGAGVFRELVDLLNRDSNSGLSTITRQVDDADLSALLQNGGVDDIGSEMLDTELVVKQLASKLEDLENEIRDILAELEMNTKYANKIALEQLEAECVARRDVVGKFLPKAQERMLALQIRYKELLAGSQPKIDTPSRQSATFYSKARTHAESIDVLRLQQQQEEAANELRLQEEELARLEKVAARIRRQEAAAKRRERLRSMQPDITWIATDRDCGG